MSDFVLDQRLADDCHVIGELVLGRVLLMDDARLPWLILVPRREAVTEVHDLSDTDQRQLWFEATALSKALKTETQARKMNIATLGNMVPQLHVHIIARNADDVAWPGPVWGVGEREPYAGDELAEVLNRYRILLAELIEH